MVNIERAEEFNTAAMKTGRVVYPRITFTTLSPAVVINKANIQTIKLNEIVNNTQETLTMGCACSNKIEISFIQDPMDKVLDRLGNLEGLKIKVEVGLKVANGDIVYAPLGFFTISEVEINNAGNQIDITAFDGISKLNQADYDSQINPTEDTYQNFYDDLIDQIQSKEGLVLKSKEVEESDDYRIIAVQQDDNLLNTLNYAAGMLGGYAHVGRDGEIEIKSIYDGDWYEDTGIVIDKEIYYANGLKKKTDESKRITYIESGINNFPVSTGNGLPGASIYFECPYMTQGAMDNIFDAIENFEYQPCELTWIGNPLLEAGDRVKTFFTSTNSATIYATTFATKFTNSGTYIFTYKNNQWTYNNVPITLGNYGIATVYTNPLNNDRLVVDFYNGTTPKAKIVLEYQKNVLIMEHTLTIDGGIKDTILCYGQTTEDSKMAWDYESASKGASKMFKSLQDKIAEITSNITGTEGGYVVLHKRGEITTYDTTINGSVAVNAATFADHFHIEGDYIFVYSGDHWTYGNEVVDINSVGILINGTPVANDTITVHLNFNSDYPDEILIMDTQSISNATNIWRFNQNGLAHSSTGYDGPYKTAITQDGKIVGSTIAANTISLNQLRPEAVVQITSDLVNHAEFNEFSDSVYQYIQESETEAIDTANDALTEYKNNVAQYLTFNGENGLIIGAVNSNFKTNLTNTKLSFVENNNEVAYISNEEFFITNGNILSRLNIGNFKFVPRSNGNLSLVYEEASN